MKTRIFVKKLSKSGARLHCNHVGGWSSVNAHRVERKMRGGAQAHLIECDNGRFYVVKFRNNPQHRRILVNEWISTAFLRYLQIAVPDTALVTITREFVAEFPEIHPRCGRRHMCVEPGVHFGSAFPGHPGRDSVYEFLPDLLVDRVANLPDFLGVLAADKWLGNIDTRQAIFCRTRLPGAPSWGFLAQMIDHGSMFSGGNWVFTDAPLYGFYFRPIVYRSVYSLDVFEPWLARIRNFPEAIIELALRDVPDEWLAGDRAALETLMVKLLSRRGRVADLLKDAVAARPKMFVNLR